MVSRRNYGVDCAAAAVCLTLALLASSCTGKKASASAPMASPVVVANVPVETVPLTHEFVGQTSAKDTVDLRARVGGFLEKVDFHEGDHVRAGQVLFQIERSSYVTALATAQAQLAKDQASLDKASKDIARLRPLTANHAASEQDLDAAVAQQAAYQAALRADRASIADAKLNLSYTTVRSPIDGIIGKLAVTRGNLVGKGDNTLLATVSSYSPIYVYFSIPEGQVSDFLRKHMRQKKAAPQLTLQLSDGTSYAAHGTLDFADRAIDNNTGTLLVRGVFPNPQGLLRPGQFARVTVAGEQWPNAVLVPQKAVSDLLNQKVVMVVDAHNLVAMQPIKIGGEYKDQYIIAGGLKGGERIIVEGLQKVRPGAPVQPIAAGASAQEGR